MNDFARKTSQYSLDITLDLLKEKKSTDSSPIEEVIKTQFKELYEN